MKMDATLDSGEWGKSPWHLFDRRLGRPRIRSACGDEENKSIPCPRRESKPGRAVRSL